MNKLVNFKYYLNTPILSNKECFSVLENLILCKFDPSNSHILSKPITLPCGNIGKSIDAHVLIIFLS